MLTRYFYVIMSAVALAGILSIMLDPSLSKRAGAEARFSTEINNIFR